ncbi:MAG: tyrosine recombinase XerD [Actinobacteria bacterium]|nr:tyrosine recombinase XerD [Actinomycetota bacterium]
MSTTPHPWVEMFLTWLSIEQGRSPRTVEAYRRDLDGLTAFLGKSEKSVEDCEASDLESFVASLKKAQLAAKTVARQLAACRTFFKFAVQENLRRDDPTGPIDGVSVPSGIPKALAEDEVAALLAACTGDDSYSRRDRALLEFLYATGARISEACGLSLSDLDMDQQVVRLFGKGSKERIVPFGAPAKRALEDWLSLGGRDVLSPKQWRTRADADAVFLGRGGRRISRQAAWNIVRKYALSAGINKDISPHVMRHSCATHMLRHGADLRVVQELLGHASVSTTQVYTRVDNDLLFATYVESHPRAKRS